MNIMPAKVASDFEEMGSSSMFILCFLLTDAKYFKGSGAILDNKAKKGL